MALLSLLAALAAFVISIPAVGGHQAPGMHCEATAPVGLLAMFGLAATSVTASVLSIAMEARRGRWAVGASEAMHVGTRLAALVPAAVALVLVFVTLVPRPCY